jgi:hypothetical protein
VSSSGIPCGFTLNANYIKTRVEGFEGSEGSEGSGVMRSAICVRVMPPEGGQVMPETCKAARDP